MLELDLRLQVILQTNLVNQSQLHLKPISMVFLGVFQLSQQDVAALVDLVLIPQGNDLT